LATGGLASDIGWQEFYTEPRLRELIGIALDHNRDLRIAALNVVKARATYRVARDARLPAVTANGSLTREREAGFLVGQGASRLLAYYSGSVGVTGFEADLYGRVASLGHAALQSYLAEAESRRALQLSLIGEVASAYYSLAADAQHLRLAVATLDNQSASHRLIDERHARGAASGLELSQAATQVEAARADAARYRGAVAEDRDALQLLVGTPLVETLEPESDRATPEDTVPALPAGLPSTVLLRRPDVLAAEHVLRAANANIGAARAAFFPAISLTGSIGGTSSELAGLFGTSTATWTFVPSVSMPIFQLNALRARLDAAKADRDIALARYEQAIQRAFQEVADGLALTATLAEQRAAETALAAEAAHAASLAEQRYRAGRDSYLTLLDARRSQYAAEQTLVATRLAETVNRITLYKALGGGWRAGASGTSGG
jgi:multidrug efflux system outer membrane protein